LEERPYVIGPSKNGGKGVVVACGVRDGAGVGEGVGKEAVAVGVTIATWVIVSGGVLVGRLTVGAAWSPWQADMESKKPNSKPILKRRTRPAMTNR
jgi:hypothetical protein